MLRVVVEGSSNDYDHIMVATIELWQNSAKWRHLYYHLEKYPRVQSYMDDEYDIIVS